MIKGNDKSNWRIWWVQTFRAAIQANNERFTRGFQEIFDMFIELSLNAKQDHVGVEDNRARDFAFG